MQGNQQIQYDDVEKYFQALNTLGKGNSGNVYLYRLKDTKKQYALKIVKTSCENKRNDARNQIQIMKQLEHQRIVKIFKYYDQTFRKPNKQKRFETGIFLERGICSLQHCLKDKSYQYDFDDIIKFIVKFIDLGAYLQSKQIVHRDIKPGNIIMFGDKLDFKLADFGLSCKAHNRPTGFAGTPLFCSPGLKDFYRNGDHRRQAKTNPYKDDVYSFALTSQQVIRHRYQLKQCPKQIQILLDEMLRHQQKDRPTFTNLSHHKIVQKYLQQQNKNFNQKQIQNNSNIKIIEKIFNNIQPFTKKKDAQLQYVQFNHHTQKFKQYKIFQVCKGLKIIHQFHNNYILCGTDSGSIYIIDRSNNSVAKLTLAHDSYISKITQDLNGCIWIAGGDGKIQLIHKQQLIRCIQQFKQDQIIKVSTLFGKQYQRHQLIINIPNTSWQSISGFHQKYISALYCQDSNHFIVGYCSGLITVKWGENQPLRSYQIHLDPITCINIFKNTIYSSDFSGFIKLFSLQKKLIEKTIHKIGEQLISFSINSSENSHSIQGFTCDGHIKTINFFNFTQSTFDAQVPSKNIIDVAYSEDQYYLLTSDGRIFLKQKSIILQNNNNQTWISLQCRQKKQIIAATQQGQVSIISLEN